MKGKQKKQEEAIERANAYRENKKKEESNPCASCKFHENNPSFCREYVKYVGRKDTCSSHRRK